MRKKVALMLVVAMGISTLGSFVACGTKKVANDENTIEVKLFEGGYGLEWFNRLSAAFKEKHPEVNFVVEHELAYGEAKTILSAGPDVTTTDLFMGSEPVMKYVLYGDSVVSGYDCALEDLSDVYNAKVEGEDITIADKMVDGFEEYYKMTVENNDGTSKTGYYSYPWVAGVMGIVYNATQFEALGISVPRTTDELFDVTCAKIKQADKVPFVSSKANTYDYYLWEVWQNQYYTLEGMDAYYQCKMYNEASGQYEYSEKAAHDIGEYYHASAIEKMIGVRYGNMHKNVNTLTYTQAQAQLLLGNAMMYVCGDWLENEMKNSQGNGDVLKYMKTPILSGIIEKTPTITNDAMLREVVSYVDGEEGSSLPAGVSDADVEYIREARKIENLATFQSAYIPAYSTSKEMAKEFLKFMATDEAIKMCLDATGGSSVPFKYDIRSDTSRWNSYSKFIQSKYDLMEGAKMPVDKNKYRLQVFGAMLLNQPKYQVSFANFTAKNEGDRCTAEEAYENRLSYFTREVLDTALQRAGLI